MSDLKLESLRIQNFRTFKDLTIDRLGRVNLIVGKNNVGKTALLEALWIWAHDEYWDDLTDQLVESGASNGRAASELLGERYEAIRHLIHGRPPPETLGIGTTAFLAGVAGSAGRVDWTLDPSGNGRIGSSF